MNVALATGLVGIPVVTRIVRSTILVTRRQTYLETAQALTILTINLLGDVLRKMLNPHSGR